MPRYTMECTRGMAMGSCGVPSCRTGPLGLRWVRVFSQRLAALPCSRTTMRDLSIFSCMPNSRNVWKVARTHLTRNLRSAMLLISHVKCESSAKSVMACAAHVDVVRDARTS